ncbi:MAG TPA: DUF1572 family protein [Phycisphaerae bacterium]|nr:DUF1572 family protein [Phycisphaerae bacterium]
MPPRTLLHSLELEFLRTKTSGDNALAQLSDEHLHTRINPLQNSVAAILQHLHGNMLSRFTDFLTSDGEKPTRDRESEFQDRQLPRPELLALWEQGWSCMFTAIAPLTDADLPRQILIRNEPHTVAQALARQLAHYGWHTGQIALIGKHLLQNQWQYLTIPPGASQAFNKKMGM